jgi:hypothetical protein
MNYNLARQRQGRIDYSIDIGMRSGDMPSTLLAEKFEETLEGGPEEDAYDHHVRREICDWTGDRNLMEHERPRGGVNRSKGILELRAGGHRGSADVERPEIFLGFGGPEDRDPRGINVDPDMKQLVRQEQSRMRFVRFTPDHSDDTTGGGRSESQVMSDNQKLFRIKREKLKIFDRQIDGRREGLRRTYKHKSDIAKQVLVQSYGDFIKDYAMNPQRRAVIVSKGVIRDSKAWRVETSDQDYQIAKYSQICKRGVGDVTQNRVQVTAEDRKHTDADDGVSYKAVGILMANIVRGKKTAMEVADGDIDMYASSDAEVRKTAPAARDLALILRAMTQDADFSSSDASMTVKTAERGPWAVVARQTVYNHIAPAHHALNAEIIYKAVRPGSDMRKIASDIITDPKTFSGSDETTAGKSAGRKTAFGRKLDVAYDDDRTESEQTVSYKTLLAERRHRAENASGEDVLKESDKSQVRRELNKVHRSVGVDEQMTDMKFKDTPVGERLGGHIGTKYTMRQVDRDGREGSIASEQ